MAYYSFFVLFLILFECESQQKAILNTSTPRETLAVNLTQHKRDGIPYTKYEIIDHEKQIVFTYTVAASEDFVYKWFLNGHEYHLPNKESGHLYYIADNLQKKVTLVIKEPTPKYSGTLSLRLVNRITNDMLADSFVDIKTRQPLVDKSHDTVRITEGADAEIKCVSTSYPKPDAVYWQFWDKNKWVNVQNGETARLNETDKGILILKEVKKSHEGYYKCAVRSLSGTDDEDAAIYGLRVRDPKALYWPLVGIAIEVLLLLITIGWYEKREYDKRKKVKLEDQKTDSDPAKKGLLSTTDENNSPRV